MPLSAKSLAGPGYIILNALRVTNIISLLAVIVASIIMLVKIVIDSQFFFFDAVSHIITAFVGVFLIVSELTLFRGYFARNWPLLSPAHGFVALGLAMEILGVNILANLNKPSMSKGNLGLSFWQVVIGAGILVIIFGFFNIIASYVFRDRNLGVTARQVRAKGAVALAEKQAQQNTITYSSSGSVRTASSSSPTEKKSYTPRLKTPEMTPKSPIRFPQFGRRTTLPSYHTGAEGVPRPPSSHYSDRNNTPAARGIQISSPININPQFADLSRPDSTYHPSNRV